MSLFDRLLTNLVATAALPLFSPDRVPAWVRPRREPASPDSPSREEHPPEEHQRTAYPHGHKSSHKGRKSRHKGG